MDILDVKANIFHLIREYLYNTLLIKCSDAKNQFSTDTNLFFYHALALILNKEYQEAVEELNMLKDETATKLAALVSLMYIHKYTKNNDKQLFLKIDSDLKDAKSFATNVDLYNTAVALFILGKYDKSFEYIEKSLNLDADYSEACCFKGWISIYLLHNGSKRDNMISEIFRNALKDNIRNLDASIGLAISLNMEDNQEASITAINKAIVRFPSSILPLIEKMNLLFSNYEYEQASEIVTRILDIDSTNLFALKTNALILICRNGKYDEASIGLKKLITEMYEQEPKNSILFIKTAKLFSRISNKNVTILSETYKLVEKSLTIIPNNPDYLTEMGYQALLQGDYNEALNHFKSATKIDDSSINALMGLTLCELSDNKKKDNVKDQVEFLLELHENKFPPLLLLMKAKLMEYPSDIFKYLDKSSEEHFNLSRNHLYSPTYLKLLDPNFLLDIIQEYLKFVPFSTDAANFKSTPNVDKAIKQSLHILRILTKACPGCEAALYLQAKILYFKGESMEAMKILEQIIKDLDTNSSDAFLLMAQIQISNKHFDRALQSLEAGLSHNFKVRENPIYHLLSGLIAKNNNNYEDAVKHFTTALNLIELKPKNAEMKTNSDSQFDFTLADKSAIYTELIQVHTDMHQIHEATKLLHDATEEFRGTPEEAKITLISADHLIKNENSQTAIDLLSKIRSDDAYYLAAKTKLAEIFLNQRKDRLAYLKCYEEMVENMPGSDSFVLLGDAFLHILELDKALEAYEKALKLNPTDPFLTKKMGEALVTTHYYQRAISYYKDTIKLTGDPDLKLELATLYVKLKQFEDAETFLKHEIEYEKNRNINDITSLKYLTKLQSLLAEIFEKSGHLTEAITVLKSTTENQQRLHKMYSFNQKAIPDEEVEISINLYKKLADAAYALRDPHEAVKFYKAALVTSPNNVKIFANLAKLYMQMNNMDLCQQTCTTLLSLNPENEDGTVLMADIAFRKIDFDMAVYHFTQLLSKQATNWRALVRFIEIMRRTGNVEGVLKYLQEAEKLTSMPSKDPGFCYCTGLYQWYSGNLNSALRNFNIARQSSEWNRQAIYNMIEICLNPEDEIVGDQLIDIDDIEYKDSRSMALKTAERLLKELKQKIDASGEDPLKYRLFKNFLLLGSKEKSNTEQALEDFISLASLDMYKEHVGPILGISTAYTMLKQSQRAKNQLKRVVKNTWSFEDAEYLEKCWLLLTDYYMQSSKYDLAYELLKKILQHNRACSKAHEFQGMIAEKEQKYKEATNAYNQAWKFSGRSNAAIGYKLAYNFMKCKKYADAIDVCQHVLKQNPDYPKIKKDILDKALNNLRT